MLVYSFTSLFHLILSYHSHLQIYPRIQLHYSNHTHETNNYMKKQFFQPTKFLFMASQSNYHRKCACYFDFYYKAICLFQTSYEYYYIECIILDLDILETSQDQFLSLEINTFVHFSYSMLFHFINIP